MVPHLRAISLLSLPLLLELIGSRLERVQLPLRTVDAETQLLCPPLAGLEPAAILLQQRRFCSALPCLEGLQGLMPAQGGLTTGSGSEETQAAKYL